MSLGQVIKAWDIGVATMKIGELSQFICKPEYAYGSAGSPPKIPPDATLVFQVSLAVAGLCGPNHFRMIFSLMFLQLVVMSWV